MRQLWNAFVVLLLLHALLVAGLGVWLWSSGRLDRQRAAEVVALFQPTIQQRQQSAQEAKLREEEARRKAEELGRVMGGGATAGVDRLAADERQRDYFDQRLDRMKREQQDLLRQLETARDTLAKQQADFAAQKQAFQKALEAETKKRGDRDFQLTVEVYEQLPSRQAKEMFQELLKAGKVAQVIDYLAAMQLRKAASVLKEFKAPDEVAQAADLVQRLRTRGVDPLLESGLPRNSGAGTRPSTSDGAS